MAGTVLTTEERKKPRLGGASGFLRRFLPGFNKTATEIGKRQQRQGNPPKKRKRKSRKRMLDEL